MQLSSSQEVDGKEILESLGVRISMISGEEILCHCPFTENHKNGDRNPSFSFNTKRLVYNCFSCGGGNLTSLVKTLQRLSDEEAERWILDHVNHLQSGANLKTEINKRLMVESQKTSSYPDQIIQPFFKFHPYLIERGISKEVARDMKVGYDETHGGITIPHYFNRKLVGWQTRHLIQDIEGNFQCPFCLMSKVPKYTNTPNFPKKNTLYNYSNAIDYSRLESKEIIVVESPMTALRLISLGYFSVVATFGAWSREQMSSLSGCMNGVILWPDNDKAGEENVKRVIHYLARLVPIRIAPVVDKIKGDPADLSESEVAEYLENCYNPFQLLSIYKKLLNLEEVKHGV